MFTATVDLLASAVPAVGGTLEAEKTKALDDIERDMLGDGDPDANVVIPSEGLSPSEIVAMSEKLKHSHSGFASGKKWGGIYHEAGERQLRMDGKWRSVSSIAKNC